MNDIGTKRGARRLSFATTLSMLHYSPAAQVYQDGVDGKGILIVPYLVAAAAGRQSGKEGLLMVHFLDIDDYSFHDK